MARTLLFQVSLVSSTGRRVTIAAWIVAALAFAAYLLLIVVALMRVRRQYGSGMQGKVGLGVASILTEGGRRWYILLAGLIALAVALLSH